MSHDYDATRRTVDGQLRKHGILAGGGHAYLERAGVRREVVAVVVGPRPSERRGEVFAPEDRKALLSAYAADGTVLDPAPDKTLDIFVTVDRDGREKNHKIVAVPGSSEPGGVVVLWKLQVRKT